MTASCPRLLRFCLLLMVLEDFFLTSEALEEPDPMTCKVEEGEIMSLFEQSYAMKDSEWLKKI